MNVTPHFTAVARDLSVSAPVDPSLAWPGGVEIRPVRKTVRRRVHYVWRSGAGICTWPVPSHLLPLTYFLRSILPPSRNVRPIDNNNNNNARQQCLAPQPCDGVIPAPRGLSLPSGAANDGPRHRGFDTRCLFTDRKHVVRCHVTQVAWDENKTHSLPGRTRNHSWLRATSRPC